MDRYAARIQRVKTVDGKRLFGINFLRCTINFRAAFANRSFCDWEKGTEDSAAHSDSFDNYRIELNWLKIHPQMGDRTARRLKKARESTSHTKEAPCNS